MLHSGILLTFALTIAWIKLPHAPRPFTSNYTFGFLIVIPLVWTLAIWIITSFLGFHKFVQSKLRIIWLVSLLMLVVWSFATQSWAFVGDTQAGVGQNVTLQLVLVIGFAIVSACAAPSPRFIIAILLGTLIVSSVIGGWQVAKQSSLGLYALGEFSLDPTQSGVSIVQANNIRWLRPYGLLPHPNILAGLLAIGLVSSLVWILQPHQLKRWLGIIAYGLGLWIFLLTFSRGAWGSFGLGLLVTLPFILRYYNLSRILLGIAIVSMAIGVGFMFLYQPFILARTGVGQESVESLSVASRIVYNDIAFNAIQSQPIAGIGGGNFPWYAAHYIHYNTTYDLRGDNVHNIYLGVWAEYGLIGLVLFCTAFLSGIAATIQRIRTSERFRLERVALLCGVIIFLAIGIFDHYPWTMLHFQILWFGMLAVGMSDSMISKRAQLS